MIPKDVIALCNLDSSTKIGSSCIGKKGIGFKSVFKGKKEIIIIIIIINNLVTNTPFVLSGEYSFKFDVTKDGELGYILPEWVQEEDFNKV